MTTQRRITRPGMHDNEFMTVTCTPDVTAVEFFEFQREAEDVARVNLHPTTTTYVGRVLKQGEHAVRGTAQHIAVCVEVDAELRRALATRAGYKGNPPRAVAHSWIAGILSGQLRAVRDEYRTAQFGRRDDEATHPGVEQCSRCGRPESATCCIQALATAVSPTCSCHPGRKCSNWPECESCGPARQ